MDIFHIDKNYVIYSLFFGKRTQRQVTPIAHRLSYTKLASLQKMVPEIIHSYMCNLARVSSLQFSGTLKKGVLQVFFFRWEQGTRGKLKTKKTGQGYDMP